MSRTTAAASDFWSGSVPTTVAGFSMGCWVNPTALPNDGQFMMVDKGSIDSNDFAIQISAVSTLRASTWGAGVAFAETTLPSTGSWGVVGAVFAASNSRSIYASASTKASDTGNQTPSGITGMHINGINVRNINGQYAHAFVVLRALADIEWAWLFASGSPRALNVDHYWYLDQSATDNDKGSSASPINLTVHGTSAGTTDPNMGTWWTAAALGNLAWTQGSAIASIDFSTKFENVHSAYTIALKQLGAGSQVSTANGSATTASTQLTLNSAAGVSVGDYVSDGPSGTKSLVLFKSSNTLLLATALTWANADAIYHYPTTTLTFAGPSISGNVLSGTPAAGDVGTYTNVVARATCNGASSGFADSPMFNITVAASGAAPSFTAGPTVNTTNTDGWTFGATPSAAATWHIGAYLKGSATPSVANIKAGAGTGFVAHVSKSITGADTQSLTGLTLPLYDVYHVLSNGSGDSAASSELALFKASGTSAYLTANIKTVSAVTKANPVSVTVSGHGRATGDWCQLYGLGGMVELNAAFAGKALKCTVVDANTLTFAIDSTGFTPYTSGGNFAWGQSLGAAFSTAVANGDIWVTDAVTAENGLPVTAQADGSVSITYGSVTSRQSFNVDVYDVSAGAMMGGGRCYFQDVAPIVPQSQSPLPALILGANQNIGSVSLLGFGRDLQGDTLSVAMSGQPGTLSVSGTNLTGTTGAAQIVPVTVTYTNQANESNSTTVNLVIGNVTPPSFIGSTQGIADPALAQLYVSAAQPYPVQNDPNPAGPAPAGQIIGQSPPGGTPIAPGSLITLTVSSGNAPPVTPPTTIVAAPTLKSTQILAAELQLSLQTFTAQANVGGLNRGPNLNAPTAANVQAASLSYLTGASPADSADFCVAGSTDAAGSQYRFFRIPSSARIVDLQLVNDANPQGSAYKGGVFVVEGGPPAVTGAEGILFTGVSMDSARNAWSSVYRPIPVGGIFQTLNYTKRVWELLGLASDPSVTYEIGITASTPGQTGGAMGLHLIYVT